MAGKADSGEGRGGGRRERKARRGDWRFEHPFGARRTLYTWAGKRSESAIARRRALHLGIERQPILIAVSNHSNSLRVLESEEAAVAAVQRDTIQR